MYLQAKFDEDTLKNILEQRGINLKNHQRQALEQLYVKEKDLVAIFLTGFGKSLVFQVLVLLARVEASDDKRPVVLVITPLTSVIKD